MQFPKRQNILHSLFRLNLRRILEDRLTNTDLKMFFFISGKGVVYWVASKIFTFMWNKTDIVKLMHVTQYKVGASIILWADHYFIVMTAYHVNACLKEICCTVENHVITPCTICHHACEVDIPRWTSVDEMKELCTIQLWEKKYCSSVKLLQRAQPYI